MNRLLICVVAILSFACGSRSATAQFQASLEELQMVRVARTQIDDFHRSTSSELKNKVRLVYFHPADRGPLAQYKSRLNRIVADVSDFYRAGLARFAVNDVALDFEKNESGYVIHVVQGQLPAAQYDYESGSTIKREIQTALDNVIDFDRAHVLAIHALCYQNDKGKYVFHTPYYGDGSQKSGFCHAADCELLDPALLTETKKRIVYSEHYYPRVDQSIGKFNSWYLGGIAHELGHGISLPHDAGRTEDQNQRGTSLMGDGNFHYREDLRGEGRAAYLSVGSALRLLSSPLLTKSNRQRFTDPQTRLDDLQFSQHDGVQVSGVVTGKIAAYAAIAYLWRPKTWPGDPQQDHYSVTVPSLITANRFDIKVTDLKPGEYRLRLAILHLNGADTNFDYHLNVDAKDQANVAQLNENVVLQNAISAVVSGNAEAAKMVTDEIIREATTPEVVRKLKVLQQATVAAEPIDLHATQQKKVSLSDAKWDSAKVGWGTAERNLFDRKQPNRLFLDLGGKFYDKGLYAHAASSFEFTLAKRWKSFSATVGVRDGALEQGSAVFTVRGDGKTLYTSPILRAGQTDRLEVDIANVTKLELVAEGGEGHVHNSWAIWVEPTVLR